MAGEFAPDALGRHFGTAVSTWIVGQVNDDLAWLCGGAVCPAAWRLCLPENHGAYLVPMGIFSYRLRGDDRHFGQLLSADRAGICATMLCVNRYDHHLADQWWPVSPKLAALERSLASFREVHPEGKAIRAVLV